MEGDEQREREIKRRQRETETETETERDRERESDRPRAILHAWRGGPEKDRRELFFGENLLTIRFSLKASSGDFLAATRRLCRPPGR